MRDICRGARAGVAGVAQAGLGFTRGMAEELRLEAEEDTEVTVVTVECSLAAVACRQHVRACLYQRVISAHTRRTLR
jgi:hypothetical protein